MKPSRLCHVLVWALIVVSGCSRERPQSLIIRTQPGATNSFTIHLQEGFYQSHEAVITVEGREVYRGTPKTDPRLGFAGGVSVYTMSDHPLVTFQVPGRGVRWSEKVDLSKGSGLGISVTPDGEVKIVQSPRGFGYD